MVEQIRTARKRKGWTQEQLAAAIRVKRSVISKYESGAISPTVEILSRIAVALDVAVWELMDDAPAIQFRKKLAEELDISHHKPESSVALLHELEQLTEADRQVLLAMAKHLRDTRQESVAVQTSTGQHYLYHYPDGQHRRPESPPHTPAGTDTPAGEKPAEGA